MSFSPYDGLSVQYPSREALPPVREDAAMQQKVTPNLWFDTEAEEAAGFYTSVFRTRAS